MRFSVVVTCYNYEAYVCEAVASALAQSRAPDEVIVVDDGSTDASAARLAERYGGDARVRVISQKNGGQLAAFVTGIRAAQGAVLCFLDADDLWEPDYLARLEPIYAAKDAPHMVMSNLRRFGNAQGVWHARTSDRTIGAQALATWLLHWFPVAPTSSISMTRRYALHAADVPEQVYVNWRVRADDCLIAGALVHGARALELAHAYVAYRVHGNNNWAGQFKSTFDQLNYQFGLATITDHYAARALLSHSHLQYAYLEFKTRQQPRLMETLRYAWLQWRAPRPALQRFRGIGAIFKYLLKAQKNS